MQVLRKKKSNYNQIYVGIFRNNLVIHYETSQVNKIKNKNSEVILYIY